MVGAIVGSFLNVCIYRMPKGESVVMPRSHCTACNKTIPWYDNLPLLSILFLKGKCRFCKGRISVLYFLVELLTALAFLGLFSIFGLSVKFVVYTILACALIVVSFIDFKIQEIPDEITLPGMVIGVALAFVFPELMSQRERIPAILGSLTGLFAGGGMIYLMGVIGKMLFRKDAMGGGDVKLMAMLGAFLGWRLIVLTFFLAPFFGAVVGIAVKLKTKEDLIPYGPHLSLAAIVALLWGENILNWIFFR